MKEDIDLQNDVQAAIKWEPLLNISDIGVTAKDGVITLTGIVDSYAKKTEIENAAKSVKGVKAVVEKIEIKFGTWGIKGDNEIATEILNTFKWNWSVPSDKVQVKVEQGWVTLEGNLNWNYQKEAAKKSIYHLTGVKGVINNIQIQSETSDTVEKRDIERALERNSTISHQNIQVEVTGNNVILNGFVESLSQKDEAGRIAWNAPGVVSVNNALDIQ